MRKWKLPANASWAINGFPNVASEGIPVHGDFVRYFRGSGLSFGEPPHSFKFFAGRLCCRTIFAWYYFSSIPKLFRHRMGIRARIQDNNCHDYYPVRSIGHLKKDTEVLFKLLLFETILTELGFDIANMIVFTFN